jgi:hypothetical protein
MRKDRTAPRRRPGAALDGEHVVCHLDAKDNIYPRKERPENKIDGVAAAIMALGRVMAAEPEPKPGLAPFSSANPDVRYPG